MSLMTKPQAKFKFKLSTILNIVFIALIGFLFARFLLGLKWELIASRWDDIARATWLTIQLWFLTMVLGTLLAWPVAIVRANRRPKVLAHIADGYVALFRGTPLLVQVFLVYYGLGGEEWVRNSFLWVILRDPYPVVLLVFTLNTAAYSSEIFRGALANTPPGQREAAMALGLTRWQFTRLVWIPTAWRAALPQFGNEMIFVLHGTAIAGLVTLNEVFGAAKEINSRFYVTYEGLITAAIIYVILAFLITRLGKYLESRAPQRK